MLINPGKGSSRNWEKLNIGKDVDYYVGEDVDDDIEDDVIDYDDNDDEQHSTSTDYIQHVKRGCRKISKAKTKPKAPPPKTTSKSTTASKQKKKPARASSSTKASTTKAKMANGWHSLETKLEVLAFYDKFLEEHGSSCIFTKVANQFSGISSQNVRKWVMDRHAMSISNAGKSWTKEESVKLR